ncbi:hypothetical protein NB311A_20241 [Nitrobacter sp. Nb-311A]|nr:hypothetical protein NB311A_20241 [Nitrobacter sp. Nb-311A]
MFRGHRRLLGRIAIWCARFARAIVVVIDGARNHWRACNRRVLKLDVVWRGYAGYALRVLGRIALGS